MLHNVGLDEGKRCAGLISEDVDRHIERGMVGQECLQPRIFVSQEGLAFDFAFVTGKRGWASGAGQRFVLLLKN